MSKAALKKELCTLSKDQLVQVILDAYSANPEIKEYFEFFVNPDVSKLRDKFATFLQKELGRSKWCIAKFRITNIKREMKKMMGFNPGPETIEKMYLTVINYLGVCETYLEFTVGQYRFISYLTKQLIEYANSVAMLKETYSKLEYIVNKPEFTEDFRTFAYDGITEAMKKGL